jgi:hypothetical protein
MTVQDKLPHYIKENLLAKSMCSQAYVNNPNFLNLIQRMGLPFKPYTDFKKADIKERILLCTRELLNGYGTRIYNIIN